MIHLSAFADEISADLNEQVSMLLSENIHLLDLRGVWGTNVLNLTDQQVTRIKQVLNEHGISVASIASPIGKVPINSPFDEHLRHFERAIELAHTFQTPFIRIFSFYPPLLTEADAESGEFVDPSEWRDKVLQRLSEMTRRASAANITLLHENEKDIYGDTIQRCVDLLQSVNNEHFQALLDPANFIQCGQKLYPDAYEAIRPWLRYIHVKDAHTDGSVVAAGEGEAQWPELLQRLRKDGYNGIFSLEPHLVASGQFQGFSGPDLFRHTSQSLQRMLQAMDWEYT